MKMIIAIDFDGTIVEHKFPEIGEAIPGAVETIKKLNKAGHTLILWTCRNNADPALNGRDVLNEAVVWCVNNGLWFDAVNENTRKIDFCPTPKVYADLYIDDRSFPKIRPQDLWLMVDSALERGGL